MVNRSILIALVASALPGLGFAQDNVTYRSAVVVLVGDPQLRMSIEDQLVATGREHDYAATTTYDIEPDVDNVDRRKFMRTLASRGIQAVLMLRPAAVGQGSSLESVRNEVPSDVYRDMQSFAKEVSSSGEDDLIAVVHMAIYTLRNGDAELVSAGAVWLDEPVESQEQGIARLRDLVVANVDAARPAIRQRLGLPPLR